MRPPAWLAGLAGRHPWRTMAALAALGSTASLLNLGLHRAGASLDTPDPWFPVSIFWARFHGDAWPALLLLLALVTVAARTGARLSLGAAWLLGSGAIVAANLVQGGFGPALIEPFTETGYQYYHDAAGIKDAGQWLAGFNSFQAELHTHARTHPPFAVLLHWLPLAASGGQVGVLAACFVLLASLALLAFGVALGTLGAGREARSALVLLLALVPSFNVYAAVSLDGVIAAAAALFLAGLCRALVHGLDGRSWLALGGGFLAMNALTFAGLFLPALAGLVAAERRLRAGRSDLLAVPVALAALGAAAWGALRAISGYDHLAAFATASRLENPGGFFALADPLDYWMTRLESVCEIVLFLSLPCAGWLVAKALAARRGRGGADPAGLVPALAALTMAAMLASGAFRTGETARAGLFLVPFLLLALRGLEPERLRDLVAMAGLQTAAMQLVGDYFW